MKWHSAFFLFVLFYSVLHFSQGYKPPPAVVCTIKITSFYRTILHRAPDKGGLKYYVGRCIKGSSLAAIKLEIYGSPERKNLCKREVTRLYKVILHRKPDVGGFKHYVRQCFNLRRPLAAIKLEFYRSKERKHLCKSEVTRLYKVILGRKPDVGGFKHYVHQCFDLRRPVSSIRATLLNSKEYKCRLAVKEVYIKYLHRIPDVGGWSYYTGRCMKGQLLKATKEILVSKERKALCRTEIIKYHSMRHGRAPSLPVLLRKIALCTKLNQSLYDIVNIK